MILAIIFGLCLSERSWCAQGEKLFNETCAACHQKGGVGAAGLAPPLVNATLWARLSARSAQYIAGVMLFGMSGKLDGPDSTLIMPPQDRLSDAQLADIGTYVLKSLNGVKVSVDAKTVAALRANPVSHAELRDLRK